MGYYRDLDVWKRAILVTKMLYILVENFPKSEMYSLVDQMKRASVSIVSNIAEGSGRSSSADNVRFLYMAQGSCVELEAQLILSEELGFIGGNEVENILTEITILQKMLFNFIQSKKKTVQPSRL